MLSSTRKMFEYFKHDYTRPTGSLHTPGARWYNSDGFTFCFSYKNRTDYNFYDFHGLIVNQSSTEQVDNYRVKYFYEGYDDLRFIRLICDGEIEIIIDVLKKELFYNTHYGIEVLNDSNKELIFNLSFDYPVLEDIEYIKNNLF